MSSAKNKNKEIELKLALPSFTDYLKLLGFIGNADRNTNQTNIFYDTPSRQISKLGYALRLRIEPNGGVITLKSATIQKGKAAVRDEIEDCITLEKAIEIQQKNGLISLEIQSITFLKSQLGVLKDLKPILQFENERIIKEIELNDKLYTFELDKTTYADTTVIYELEIELDGLDKINNAVADIERLFKSLKIEFQLMKKSKFERALEVAELN